MYDHEDDDDDLDYDDDDDFVIEWVRDGAVPGFDFLRGMVFGAGGGAGFILAVLTYSAIKALVKKIL